MDEQAEATAKTVAKKVLAPSVASIRMPEFGQWTPIAPALLAMAGRVGSGTTRGHTPSRSRNWRSSRKYRHPCPVS